MNNIQPADLKELEKQYQGEQLDIVLNKIESGYPVQYAIGNVNFCGNTIIVNEDVLIPRYETEFLVDLIINKIDKDYDKNIIDIGTGSGCISISLAKKFEKSHITGIDISEKAIKIANENKELNKVTNVTFEEKDLRLIKTLDNYDLVVSNPPYVSKDEFVGSETQYEPQNAIFADKNGLEFYVEIIRLIKNTEKKPSYIFFEIGMLQSDRIIKLCEENISEYKYEVLKDLSGKDRYMYLYLNK